MSPTTTASNAIRAALRGFDPSEEQWDAIRAPMAPMAVIAGAGSGKTAVMTARIIWLVEQGLVNPGQVLALTFTSKAAGEIEARLTYALGEMTVRPVEHPTMSTYHAFALQILTTHGPRIGVDAEFGLLSTAQKWQMLMGLVNDIGQIEVLELRHPLSFINQTIELADQCANHLVDTTELRQACDQIIDQVDDKWIQEAARKRKDLAEILDTYTAAKRKRRGIDFGDQLVLTVRILESFPDVARGYAERFPVVLLDEYQDTNPAQKLMLQHICPPGTAVTAVGDARQAIYGWRGASMFNLIHFGQDFHSTDGSPCLIKSLSDNYRSGARIVQLANRIISKVGPERRPGVELKSVASNGEGWVGASVYSDDRAEAEAIAVEIERLHSTGLEWRDIAVLYRKKSLMEPLIAELQARDIPMELPELGGLLKIPAVVDTIAWLNVLSDNGTTSNRWAARILMGPAFRIHYRDLAPIARWAVTQNRDLTAQVTGNGSAEPDPGEIAYSLLDALRRVDEIEQISTEAVTRVKEFIALIDELCPEVSGPLLDVISTVAERTGIVATLLASTSRMAPAMLENLRSFIGLAGDFAPIEGDSTLNSFIDYLDAAVESDDAIPLAMSSSSDSVKVMTVHGAKGLEFNSVFIPALSSSASTAADGMRKYSHFPDVRMADPMNSATQLPPAVRRDAEYLPKFEGNKSRFKKQLRERVFEDERRLFYVATTRAEQRLYCSGAWYYGSDVVRGPSVFLEEVMEQSDLVEVLVQAPQPDENPVAGQLRTEMTWPPQPERVDDKATALLELVDSLIDDPSRLEAALKTEGARTAFAAHEQLIADLTATNLGEVTTSARRTVSATQAVHHATSDGDEFVLPQRPTEAQRLGIEVHAWIEERARGLIGLADDEMTEASLVPEPQTVERLRNEFEQMGFDKRKLAVLDTGEPMAELPFTLKVGDVVVRGRIDAVYEADGQLEIVDFKTGIVPDAPDWGQLELYAEALNELGLAPATLKLTYAYLRTGEHRSTQYVPHGLDWIAARLNT